MTSLQKEILSKLSKITCVYLVGGAVRDQLLGLAAKDADVVTELDLEELEQKLKSWGYHPLKIGAKYLTVSVFSEGERIDFTNLRQNLETDALRRDFTINAIYQDIQSGEFLDPLGGQKDLREKRLRACGSPSERMSEDPIRILRMVRFKVKYQLAIEAETKKTACELIETLAGVASERITEELGRILVLDSVEEALRLLEEIGYWRAYLPELERLKGLVQNQYHAKDAWEHTLHVVRNTPPQILLRLAGLFHDLGKWETASRECYAWGKLEGSEKGFYLNEFQIMGKQLQRWRGQYVEVHGARLDYHPYKIQVKHIRKAAGRRTGFEWVVEGKRHFLGHEKESARLARQILPRFRFSMVLGSSPSGEKELLWLIENHMSGTLAFMSELKGEVNLADRQDKVRRFVWEKAWDGREFQQGRLLHLLALWRADFFGGKLHEPQDEEVFDQLMAQIRSAAEYLEQRKKELNWTVLEEFTQEKNLKGKEIGEFKEHVLTTVMLNERNQPDNLILLEKEYHKYRCSLKSSKVSFT
ncbi:CCA tRNA nucleotidyltransferase [Desulfitobacterium sp.]|uniref:CCA tRNA nucleotidyltransferase n=1 Tax=Desulfitobacterium sp. TaxID=49981 RepID=UPI002C316685|nr:CCA tRNA nucleotidyltransferase [Desulfitobacterium sp.]HVJ49369.1 CCA tRNA nucleotidyltransferase [Desulfitobacterium sp.]